jgi:hypothetical protein
MSHFAKVNNGVVENVLVAETDFFDSFVDDSPGEWIQTSYNTWGGVHKLGGTPFRKNYAIIGGTYDVTKDAFIPPNDFPSWTLNEDTCRWDPPITKPVDEGVDGKWYRWDEAAYQADNATGWVVRAFDPSWHHE